MQRSYVVLAFWDDEASVWVASSEDVPGLATEAETVDALISKLKVMVPEILELNGVIESDIPHVPFSLMTQIDGLPLPN